MNRAIQVLLVLFVIGGCTLAFIAPALANDAGPTETTVVTAPDITVDPVDVGTAAVSAGVRGDWWAMLSGAVLLLVWALRTGLRKWKKFEQWAMSDLGAPLLTLIVAFLLAMATPLATGPPSLATLKVAAVAALLAVGGWHTLAKRVLIPGAAWIWGKIKG